MRGKGKVEFLSCYDEIKVMIDNGYSIKRIFRVLSSEGKISVKYAYFHRLLKNHGLKALKLNPLIISKNKNKSCNPVPLLPAIRGESLPASFEEEDEDFGIIRTPEDKLF